MDRAAGEDAAIPDDLPVDTVWDDIYEPTVYSPGNGAETTADNLDTAAAGTGSSLLSYLQWQLDLSPFSDNDRLIATTILDALSEDGYLPLSPEDILAALPGDRGLDIADIRTVLKRIQRFDPPGVAAILSDRGIDVARRTVAKYRETMRIPPSNERKRLASDIEPGSRAAVAHQYPIRRHGAARQCRRRQCHNEKPSTGSAVVFKKPAKPQ